MALMLIQLTLLSFILKYLLEPHLGTAVSPVMWLHKYLLFQQLSIPAQFLYLMSRINHLDKKVLCDLSFKVHFTPYKYLYSDSLLFYLKFHNSLIEVYKLISFLHRFQLIQLHNHLLIQIYYRTVKMAESKRFKLLSPLSQAVSLAN